MLPSPSSSLSSFQDYYHHSSQNSDHVQNQQQLSILAGLQNFKIVKLFLKICRKINQQNYWLMFLMFKKLAHKQSKTLKRIKAESGFRKILVKIQSNESQLNIKNQYLIELTENMNEKRKIQIKKALFFGLKFIKQNYVNLAIAYRNFTFNETKTQSESVLPKDKAKYLRKLSKATLSIILRNIIQLKLSTVFLLIKGAQALRIGKTGNSITFFKQKKEKQIYVHRNNNRLKKLNKLLSVCIMMNKKIIVNYKYFWRVFNEQNNKPLIKQEEGDNPQIMVCAVNHMVYLTKHFNNKKTKNENEIDMKEIKILQLQSILKANQMKSSQYLSEYLLRWRKATNQQHLLLRKQILKLEEIKQYYMEQC